MVDTRPAAAADIESLAGALARSFHDDPVMIWLFGPKDALRLRRLRRWFASEARRHMAHGEVLVGVGHEGGAFWDPPGRWKPSWGSLVRSAPAMVPAVGPRIPRARRGLGVIEKAHPREPHWYLAALGTDPPHQGKGVGAALMRPVLERCDGDGLGAYLESSKERNVPYYERFGFVVTGELRLPDGPPIWPMWRDPPPRTRT